MLKDEAVIRVLGSRFCHRMNYGEDRRLRWEVGLLDLEVSIKAFVFLDLSRSFVLLPDLITLYHR